MFLTEIQFDTFKGKGEKIGDEGKYVLGWFDFFKKKKNSLNGGSIKLEVWFASRQTCFSHPCLRVG